MQLQQHHLGVNFTVGHTCSTMLSERYYDIMATHKTHIAYKTHTKSKIFWLGGIWYRVIGMLHKILLSLCTAHSSTLASSIAHSSTVDCSTAAHKGLHPLPTAVCLHTAQMLIQHYIAGSVALRTDTAVHTQPVHTQQIPA